MFNLTQYKSLNRKNAAIHKSEDIVWRARPRQ